MLLGQLGSHIKLDLYTIHKHQLKTGYSFSLRHETVKLLEESGEELRDTWLDSDVLDMTPKAQVTKAKPDGTASR